jgi:hypothetical protein
MADFGKRTRLTPTRAGLVTETFFVCYYCPAELMENELPDHKHNEVN